MELSPGSIGPVRREVVPPIFPDEFWFIDYVDKSGEAGSVYSRNGSRDALRRLRQLARQYAEKEKED